MRREPDRFFRNIGLPASPEIAAFHRAAVIVVKGMGRLHDEASRASSHPVRACSLATPHRVRLPSITGRSSIIDRAPTW